MSKLENLLPTDGAWGVSCVCTNEAMLGALLGMTHILGCENVAWVKIAGKRATAAPAPVERAIGKPPKGRKSGKRKSGKRPPASAIGAEFLARAKSAAGFSTSDVVRHFGKHGYSDQTAYNALHMWKTAGSVKRTGPGKYLNLSRKLAA